MANLIVGLVLVAIVGASITKIVIEKKKGAKCIGCPAGGSSKNGCCCGSEK
jgi:hypothetical protein